MWFSGTGVSGTSTTASIFTNSGVTSANVNDYYLNTSTGYVYKCTVAGAASAAKWAYVGSIRGATGSQGATGGTGPTGATGTRGSLWYSGTAVTGTNTSGAIFSSSGISSALVNDYYLNTSTGYVYKCTVAGAASVAKWAYVGSIRGATGAAGSNGTNGTNGSNVIAYAECSTAASTNAKVASIVAGTFSLTKGARVTVKFTNANSASNATLNINSTGAKTIRYGNSSLTSSQYWIAGQALEFVYDGTYWCLVGVAKDNNSTYSLSSFGVTATASELNHLDGIKSTVSELNYLHKESVTKTGWLMPEEGTVAVESLYGASGVIGFKIGNTYTFTATYKDGTTETENVKAIDSSEWDYDPGAVILQCGFNESIMIIDKANVDVEYNITAGTNHYWYPPSVIDEEIESILVTGTKSDGTALTHTIETYNKIPEGHLPDTGLPPITQTWEWNSSDEGGATEVVFKKPEGYNRCEIHLINRDDVDSASAYTYPPAWIIMPTKDNSYYSDLNTVNMGQTINDVKLGRGEGTTTSGGKQWVTSGTIHYYFSPKIITIDYTFGTEVVQSGTITSTEGYPESFSGQFALGLEETESSSASLISSDFTWVFAHYMYKNKQNSLICTWYEN